jgi:hypothetical protein
MQEVFQVHIFYGRHIDAIGNTESTIAVGSREAAVRVAEVLYANKPEFCDDCYEIHYTGPDGKMEFVPEPGVIYIGR